MSRSTTRVALVGALSLALAGCGAGANLAGVPSMSIPCGFVGDLHVGLQIAGPHFGVAKLLIVALAYQKETVCHRRLPDAFQKETLS